MSAYNSTLKTKPSAQAATSRDDLEKPIKILVIVLAIAFSSPACAVEPATLSPSESAIRDAETVRALIRDAQANNQVGLEKVIKPSTVLRIDGRDEANTDARKFARAITGCKLIGMYQFGGNGIGPSARDGETIVMTDWACSIPAEADGDTSWSFEFKRGTLLRLHNDPTLL